jgi:5-methylcytosine-specific restriction protein A
MRVKRSKEFWLVAFFLSKYGNPVHGKDTEPPLELVTKTWQKAYKKLYATLGIGMPYRSFANSMKNCRDTFDGHTANSGRVGWRDKDGSPIELPLEAEKVYKHYRSLPREVIWAEIESIISRSSTNTMDSVPKKLKKANPDWTREELILALELYFDLEHGQMHKGNPKVIQLSNELRAMNIHNQISDLKKFRNPSSISRRLANFKTMDLLYAGDGLYNSGKLAKEVFKEYSFKKEDLVAKAKNIRKDYGKQKDESLLNSDINEAKDSGFAYELHKNRETDPLVMRLKRGRTLTEKQGLRCEICGFDSHSFYGEIGKEMMEVHYIRDLGEKAEIKSNYLEDLIIVCSNCHRVLDKYYGILDFTDLKKLISKDDAKAKA